MGTVGAVKCPYCGKDVSLIYYGRGYIAVCCHGVIYNADTLPDGNGEPIVRQPSVTEKK
jgi:hypothetical protein